MKKKDASFWSDIKSLDERLSRDPDSFCFARLSEIYLKVGLVADALHTARSGVAKHPGYLAGQRALAMACNASGLHDESRVVLEQVTAAMPEDVDAQKVLAGLYVTAGDHVSAIRAYRTVLDFRPDDTGSSIELEALQRDSAPCLSDFSTSGQVDTQPEVFVEANTEEEIIELSEDDVVEEPEAEDLYEEPCLDTGKGTLDRHDPLSTLTLAELYEQQGYLAKALDIYHTILADDPENAKVLAKIAQLEEQEPVSENIPEEDITSDIDEEIDYSEPVDFETEPLPLESRFEESITQHTVDAGEPEISASEGFADVTAPLESNAFAPLAHKAADNVVETLDVWLENIRRIKACR
jgi:tetratricopeptide (TPR) repeat protein